MIDSGDIIHGRPDISPLPVDTRQHRERTSPRELSPSHTVKEEQGTSTQYKNLLLELQGKKYEQESRTEQEAKLLAQIQLAAKFLAPDEFIPQSPVDLIPNLWDVAPLFDKLVQISPQRTTQFDDDGNPEEIISGHYKGRVINIINYAKGRGNLVRIEATQHTIWSLGQNKRAWAISMPTDKANRDDLLTQGRIFSISRKSKYIPFEGQRLKRESGNHDLGYAMVAIQALKSVAHAFDNTEVGKTANAYSQIMLANLVA